MVPPTLGARAWMPSFSVKTIRDVEFLVFHVLCKFCSFYAPSPFSPCCALLVDEATHYRAPTLRGRAWMPSFHVKRIPNIEFFLFHVLHEFCSFYALRTFSPCCSLPFDKATHYGTPDNRSKGMDAILFFQNDSSF